MRTAILAIFLTLIPILIWAQVTTVKGSVYERHTVSPLTGVKVTISGTDFITITDSEGRFMFQDPGLPSGEQVLELQLDAYEILRIPIVIEQEETIAIESILMQLDLGSVQQQLGVIELSHTDLDRDEGFIASLSGMLQASDDVFLRAAAYDFSATFFRPRGLDSRYGSLLINGVEMNDLYTGRPNWAQWGGLNDLQRNKVHTTGFQPNDVNFGAPAGVTHITMRPSRYRKGGRFSFAQSNRSYSGRMMGSFSSGSQLGGWSYALALSRRYAKEGMTDGTLYDANSFYVGVEKSLNAAHSLAFTGFYTPNRRGRSAPLTQEVLDIKGYTYNPYWGLQNGEIRNSRIRETQIPVLMLNHYWDLSNRMRLNSFIGYQFGKTTDTRLETNGNRNPFGNFYQRLPSYFLRDDPAAPHDHYLAFQALQELRFNGQLDWNALYEANSSGTNASYFLYADEARISAIDWYTSIQYELSDTFSLTGKITYRKRNNHHYARILDLLGATGHLDTDPFGTDPTTMQSDLEHPDRVVGVGDRFRYDYKLLSNMASGFLETQLTTFALDLYAGVHLSNTTVQRHGNYRNGYFPEGNRSFGAGVQQSFLNYALKLGGIYKLTARHVIGMNSSWITRPPVIQYVYPNARQNNDIIHAISSEQIRFVDLSYWYRNPILNGRITGYYIGFDGQSDVGFFFTENALGNESNTAFVQEIVTGIATRHMGAELGISAQVIPQLKLKAVAAIGQHVYTKDPEIYLSGDDFDDPATPVIEGKDMYKLGKRPVFLKNYHVAAGPERAFQLGFEYQDPEFWFAGMTLNHYANAYVDVSKLRRAADFLTTPDGLPVSDVDPETVKKLLKQEVLDPYMLVNVTGGKSWRVRDYYIGFFASLNNILNTKYLTGGFEDSRRAGFYQQMEEQGRSHGPLFGNRYFPGYGASYYLNVYIRF